MPNDVELNHCMAAIFAAFGKYCHIDLGRKILLRMAKAVDSRKN